MVEPEGFDDGFYLLDQRVAPFEVIASTDFVEVEVLVPHEILDDVLVAVDHLLELLGEKPFGLFVLVQEVYDEASFMSYF